MTRYIYLRIFDSARKFQLNKLPSTSIHDNYNSDPRESHQSLFLLLTVLAYQSRFKTKIVLVVLKWSMTSYEHLLKYIDTKPLGLGDLSLLSSVLPVTSSTTTSILYAGEIYKIKRLRLLSGQYQLGLCISTFISNSMSGQEGRPSI